MEKNSLIKTILGVSIIGVLFSGYLTYQDLAKTGVSCTIGTNSTILGLPVCVYGLIMYLLIFTLSILALKSKNTKT